MCILWVISGHALMVSVGFLLKKLAHEHNIAVLVSLTFVLPSSFFLANDNPFNDCEKILLVQRNFSWLILSNSS